MKQDKEQKIDISLRAQFLIAGLTAALTIGGTCLINFLNISNEFKNLKNQHLIAREEEEFKQVNEDLKDIIKLYEDVNKNGGMVLAILRDEKYPIKNPGKLLIPEEPSVYQGYDKRFHDAYYEINKKYLKINEFYAIDRKLNGDVLLTLNGYATVIFAWLQSKETQRKFILPHLSKIFWLPQESVAIPPRSAEECDLLINSFTDMANKQIRYLKEFRKKILREF